MVTEEDKFNNNFNTFTASIAYLPNIAFYVLMFNYKNCTLNLMQPYQKATFFNRTYIAAANGKLMLSVPLKKKNIKSKKHFEIEIAYEENWQKNHFESICSAYLKSPYLEILYDDLKAIIFEKHQYLYQLNFEIIKWINKVLQLNIKLKLKIDNDIEPAEDQLNIANYCNKKIEPFWFKNEKYYQLFEAKNGFIGNLSILDLLFLKGMESRNYLIENFNKK